MEMSITIEAWRNLNTQACENYLFSYLYAEKWGVVIAAVVNGIYLSSKAGKSMKDALDDSKTEEEKMPVSTWSQSLAMDEALLNHTTNRNWKKECGELTQCFY